MEAECLICKKWFTKTKSNQIYCSGSCRSKAGGQIQYKKNRSSILEKLKTPEHREKMREYSKTPQRREKHREWAKNRKRQDGAFKLKHLIIDRIRSVEEFKRLKHSKLEEYLGYGISELYAHLVRNLTDGLTEVDILTPKKLELDHIIPFHWFLVQDLGDGEFRKCWNMKNLRFITREENRKRKRKSFNWDEIVERDLVDLLPKGANEIWKERNK